MSNKEKGNYRPHFLAIQDSNLAMYKRGIHLTFPDIERIKA